MVIYLEIYLVLVNAAALVLYAADKRRARNNAWRVSEAALIGIAAAGGSVGALIGMNLFHHKTRKVKFSVGVPLILTAQIFLLMICTYYLHR